MSDEPTATRRRLLGAGVATLASLAGCSTGVEEEPDPRVVNEEPGNLLDVQRGREIDVKVLIHNVGDAGEIVVTVETFDEASIPEEGEGERPDPVDTASKTVEMEGQSQREITVTMFVSVSARLLDARAAAASEIENES
jgi:hypothetical protein